jgi:hypothetical protein
MTIGTRSKVAVVLSRTKPMTRRIKLRIASKTRGLLDIVSRNAENIWGTCSTASIQPNREAVPTIISTEQLDFTVSSRASPIPFNVNSR